MKIDRTPFVVSIIFLIFGFGPFILPSFTALVFDPEGNFWAAVLLACGFFGLGRCSVSKRRYHLLSEFEEYTKLKFIYCIGEASVSGTLVIFILDNGENYNVLIEKHMYDERIKNTENKEFFILKGDLIPVS